MDTEETPPVSSAATLTEEQVDESTEEDSLVKESCHDSGIDIRDTSIPPIIPVQTNKKVSTAAVITDVSGFALKTKINDR